MTRIPGSVIRNQFKAARNEQKRQVRAAARGEKIMAGILPNRGYAWNSWTQDRARQVQHMKNWVGVCIDKIANLVAQLVPNVAYVSPKSTQKRFKDGSRFDGNLQHIDCGGHSFIAGGYRRKALGVIKPHEDIEPVEQDHPLRRLIESPNAYDTQFDHDYELIMFQLLCGVAYDWAVPHETYGQFPKELWCIPSHWVWARTGTGEVVDPQNPFADRIIAYYDIRPWGGTGSWAPIRIPPDQIIRYTYKSPISKIDGWAKTTLMANWIDADDSIAKSQFAQMSNAAMPSFWLELGEGYEDPTDDQIDRIGSKFMARYQGELNMGKPFIGPPGTVPHPLSFPPLHMAYGESGDQSRDRIVSGFGLNLPILGLSENQTFGSVLANLMSVSVHTLKPLLTAKGQRQTKDLGSKFGSNIRVWYDDPTPIDPDQLNKDIQQDFLVGAIVPNEVRDIRGRPAYEHGGDDPLVPGPGGLIPLPLATGYDLSGYAELVPLMGKQENPAAEKEEAESGLGSPQVEEPNGEPQKQWGGRLKSFNEADHPRNESGEFGPKNGLPASSGSRLAGAKPDDPIHEYIEAFDSTATVQEARQANRELRQDGSKFRLVPDGKGGWDAKKVSEIVNEFGAKWTVALNPLTGKPDAGDAAYFLAVKPLAGDKIAQSYLYVFNEDPSSVTSEELAVANQEMEDDGSGFKLEFSGENDLWIAIPKGVSGIVVKRFRSLKNFNEADHPRADDGKFGPGSGLPASGPAKPSLNGFHK